jgi:DNA-directed RNA polymerase subunit L
MFANLKTTNSRDVSFDILGVDLSVVNAVRRVILADVKTAAFCFSSDDKNTVEITKNTSVLHNEFLGHRISLIPVYLTENESIDATLHEDLVFHLHARNDGIVPRDVTSGDISIYKSDGELLPDDVRDRMFPPDAVTQDYILITRLKPSNENGQDAEEIDIKFKLSIGSGRDHARYTPTSMCAYGNIVDESMCEVELSKETEKSIKSGANEEEVQRVIHDFKTMGRQRCYAKNERGEPYAFTFRIRSECGLRSTYIFFKALSILYEKMVDISKDFAAATKWNPDDPDKKVTVEASSIPGICEFSVLREDHTMGNLVQSLLFNAHVHENDSKEIEYIGYYQPHPLETRIIFRIKSSYPVAEIGAFIGRCIEDIGNSVLKPIMEEFATFADIRNLDIEDVDRWFVPASPL